MAWHPIALAVLFAGGCASIHYPELPGPPKVVDCQVQRDNSLTGTYRCTFEGEYVIREVN